MRKVLLDTNAYSRLKFDKAGIGVALNDAEVIYMSAVVLGELFFGFLKGSKKQWNEEGLSEFFESDKVRFCGIDQQTSRLYSEIWFQLEKAGKLIPVNDIWIAAQAMRMNAELITFDGHFRLVKGLRVWKGD